MTACRRTGWRTTLAFVAAVSVAGAGTAVGSAAAPAPTASVQDSSAWGDVTSRASVSSAGRQGNEQSEQAEISAGGRYVAFTSNAPSLVAGDTNQVPDVFVRDRLAGVTRRVSVGPGGRQGDEDSRLPSISASGRFVAFQSFASNLVAGDTNGLPDVFVRDVVAGVTRRVSVGPGGRQGNDFGGEPAISADGRHVAFDSDASNLVADDTNGVRDVFVRDLVAGVTQRVSVGPKGRQARGDNLHPAISARGQHVAFASAAPNLVADDTNNAFDVFVRDRAAGVTRRVSVGPGSRQADDLSVGPAISRNGRYVVFSSFGTNLVAGDTNRALDVFVRDRTAGLTQRVSVGPGGRQGNGSSGSDRGVSISADGRNVAFDSSASNLVPDDTNQTGDAFVRDRLAGVTRRASVGPGGRQADADSFDVAVSANGRHTAFTSFASNLVVGDTNGTLDVLVRDQSGDWAGRVADREARTD